jgi:predicted dinucleotide-binding enzyme
MTTIRTALLGLALVAPLATADDCAPPEVPQLPDGATSTMEQMLAGQKAVKAFQTANLEYMSCLEGDLNAADQAVKSASEDEKADAQAAYDKAVDAYNAAVSREEEVAGQFNTEIRAYKAANPS